MKLRIFTEPQQGATYDDLLAVAKATERLGFDAFFRSDHYQRIGPGDPGPGSTDAWITLAGLARETSAIRLGTLVTPATFRLPGPLAISVAQVDQMSGGRVELGFGTGWFDGEHTAYGIPFPPLGERFARWEEQLEIITGLWTAEEGYSFEGAYYRVADSPALPKPAQRPGPPIIIGGIGAKRTPRMAARFADEYNVPFHSVEETRAAFERVRLLAERPMTYSAAQTVCVGADEAEVERRAAAIGNTPARLRQEGLAGTPAEVLDKIGRFAEAGAERIYLQVLDLSDLEHLELIAAEVLPHV
ncbi:MULTISPECIES: LLM class F420-dependent oxidoreductase [unclassified Nonomuraea]